MSGYWHGAISILPGRSGSATRPRASQAGFGQDFDQAKRPKSQNLALFKIVQRVGIEHRVGYVTCDNATNNGTMLIEFAHQFKLATKQRWDPIERRINQSPHFNSHEPTAHIPDTSAVVRDEIGLVRAIAVKERSSAKRKELFRNIQIRKRPDSAEIARQMVLDMKDVDTFVFEMAQEEGGAAKREKLEALRLRPDEWVRVDLFLNLLACAEEAQHAFSSDPRSTLHLAIPALEKLHAQWKLASEDAKYEAYWPALEAAMAKVDEYYQKTSNSDAYLLAMGN
ncbi:hypothetical protein DFH07DRAFT_771902 [Mycena maculata]|uniref:Uncharacterized protein n=1 Tax=Mycena maculata TaxID=230809 RepID=A0AAD7JA98_9AGAR|nr:hypothetical protein DFH07DRAFT_771902 [Mycena maculata]